MSGEFGEYGGCGYFHTKVEGAAVDCEESREDITRRVGAILRALVPLARDVSWFEAADSSVASPIMGAVEALPNIRQAVSDLETYLQPFKRVAEDAVRKAATEGARR